MIHLPIWLGAIWLACAFVIGRIMGFRRATRFYKASQESMEMAERRLLRATVNAEKAKDEYNKARAELPA